MLNTVFMGTAPFGFPVLRAMGQNNDVNILGVFTQPDRERGRGREAQSPPVADFTRELDLPLYQPEDINDDGFEMLDSLENLDVAFVVAYGQFLDEKVFDLPSHGTYNFHASLLPRWRGAAPIRHTLLAGDDHTGVTLFRIWEGMDSGPVCHQVRTAIEDDETYGDLYERLSELNVGALELFLEELKRGQHECHQQEGEVTHAPMIDSDDAKIHWNETAEQIERHIRAFCPDPGAFSLIRDNRIKIYQSKINGQSNTDSKPGTVVQVTSDTIAVQTGDGTLSIKEIQPAGSRRMDVGDYLAGHPDLSEGDRFQIPKETV